jgi:hypothetical protein
VALNWSKQRNRDRASKSDRAARDAAAYLADLDHSRLREQGRRAVTNYRKPVRIFPRIVKLKCGKCGHRGTVKLMPHITHPRFRCSECGTGITC